MTEKEIRKYIDRLNNKKGQESIFTRPISEKVEIGRVWSEQPKKNHNPGSPSSYKFFFIKNDLGIYVGAILDMHSDLHWYVIPKERKKGFLTKSLKETILPYLFQERDEQKITIGKGIGEKNHQNSKTVALKLGFNPIDEQQIEFLLKKSEFNLSSKKLNEVNSRIGNERIEILTKRVNYASKILEKVSDELLMAYADDKKLLDIPIKLESYSYKIEDLMWKYEKSK
ncbi:MAG: hypothetical protein JJE55_15170 [Flavobacteriaceae bacterium]|nr:hypothetical protein [Flavobacteriaceae bacterium]